MNKWVLIGVAAIGAYLLWKKSSPAWGGGGWDSTGMPTIPHSPSLKMDGLIVDYAQDDEGWARWQVEGAIRTNSCIPRPVSKFDYNRRDGGARMTAIFPEDTEAQKLNDLLSDAGWRESPDDPFLLCPTK